MTGSGTRPRELALIFFRDHAGGREFLRGVCSAIRETGRWRLALPIDGPWFEWRHVGERRADGFVGPVYSREQAERVARLGIPSVFVYTPKSRGGGRSLTHDNVAVAELAAGHLIGKGFSHFGTVGFDLWPFWQVRTEAFRAAVAARGGDCHAVSCLDMDREAVGRVGAWLRGLPRPCGVFCATDSIAAWLIILCGELGLEVPGEVAVVSAGHDPLLNVAFDTTITSVILDDAGMGRRAVAALEDPGAADLAPVPPLGVFEGASTGFVAPGDLRLRRALQIIQDRAPLPISVAELARRAGIGRRSLELGFARHVGRSPQKEIARARMERARALLIESADSIERVSEVCGFSYPHHFIGAFRRHFGITPLQMRKRGLRPSP